MAPRSITDVVNCVRKANGKQWGGRTDFTCVDTALNHMLPLKGKAVRTHSGSRPNCKETVEEIKANFWTIVLATVVVGGWRMPWVHNMVQLVLSNYTDCQYLFLHALKGGDACDCEISFIRNLMPYLGFTTLYDGVYDASVSHTRYVWYMSRPGTNTADYNIWLYVHDKPEEVSVGYLRSDLHPSTKNSMKPNLARLAVVSAPVHDKSGERADEKLNKKLVEALENVMKLDVPGGFKPDVG